MAGARSSSCFAIFFFVLREGAPVLFGALNIKEFFTSVNWRPDSTIRPQFGILALLAGTASVTALAMVISVPAGDYPLPEPPPVLRPYLPNDFR